MEPNSTSTQTQTNQNKESNGCGCWTYLIVIGIIIALSFGIFQSCGSLDGTYKLVKVTDKNGNIIFSQDTLTAVELSSYKASATITINGDRATANLLTSFDTLLIDKSAKTMTDSTGTVVHYKHSGKTLTLIDTDSEYVFEKQ